MKKFGLTETKLFGLTETKLFYFNRIFTTEDGEVVQANPLNPLWIRHCWGPQTYSVYIRLRDFAVVPLRPAHPWDHKLCNKSRLLHRL